MSLSAFLSEQNYYKKPYENPKSQNKFLRFSDQQHNKFFIIAMQFISHFTRQYFANWVYRPDCMIFDELTGTKIYDPVHLLNSKYQ